MTASSELPVAIAAASVGDPCTVRLVSAAPSQTPGHTRGPASRIDASAMPEGGHTAVA